MNREGVAGRLYLLSPHARAQGHHVRGLGHATGRRMGR
jgi:hypothetical protein